jgi:hypothetical protein
VDYWDELGNLPAEEYARRFRYFTPAQLRDSMQARGLDVDCTDEETLTALARIDARYLREREAGAEAAVAS